VGAHTITVIEIMTINTYCCFDDKILDCESKIIEAFIKTKKMEEQQE
jgi:hypothetical protein